MFNWFSIERLLFDLIRSGIDKRRSPAHLIKILWKKIPAEKERAALDSVNFSGANIQHLIWWKYIENNLGQTGGGCNEFLLFQSWRGVTTPVPLRLSSGSNWTWYLDNCRFHWIHCIRYEGTSSPGIYIFWRTALLIIHNGFDTINVQQNYKHQYRVRKLILWWMFDKKKSSRKFDKKNNFEIEKRTSECPCL